MKKAIILFLIVFVLISFSLPVFADYDTRQLPWSLEEIEGMKVINIF